MNFYTLQLYRMALIAVADVPAAGLEDNSVALAAACIALMLHALRHPAYRIYLSV
jgi:hypothetical protein